MDTYCDACGAKKIPRSDGDKEGRHPNVTCSEKEWAAHQARLLGQIVNLLKQNANPPAQNAPARTPEQSAKTDAAKSKSV